jgi:hypothetical protein
MKIIKSVPVIICFLLIINCNESKQNASSSTDNQIFENEILSWYNNHKVEYTSNPVVKKKFTDLNVPIVINPVHAVSIDPVLCPSDRDKLSYLYLNREGFSPISPDALIKGMMIPEIFQYTDSNYIYEFYGRIISSNLEYDDLLSLLDLQNNEFHPALNNFKSQMSLDGTHIYLISGIEYRDYEAAINVFSEDEIMKQLFVNNPEEFKKLYSDCYKNSCTMGFYTYSFNEYVIYSNGSHSRDEVLCALQIHNGIGRTLNSTEAFWVSWVLGNHDKHFLADYPALSKVYSANYSIPKGSKINCGVKSLNYIDEVSNHLKNNTITDIVSISKIRFKYKYYE